MDAEIIRNYAKLIVRNGLNVQPGQEVIIRAEVELCDFVTLVTEECYKAGASRVDIDWRFTAAQRLDIEWQSAETLAEVRDYEELRLRYRSEKLPASLYIDSDDPDGLNGIDHAKWAKAQQERYKVIRPYRESMENRYRWCVAAAPGKAWARKVFPDLPEDEAVEKLWEAIISCSRAMCDDPISVWDEHNDNLRRRCEKLNSLKLRRLIYRSKTTGTDFSVGLIPECSFMGGAESLKGTEVYFNANIPTEEVFTTPRRGDAEGIVVSTRPLSYRGALIENFSLRFENGAVTEVHAERGEEALKTMIGMDKGACMLGECALVPYNSPIRESGILFFNTLFDENASCHLALGNGYSCCVEGHDGMSVEQLHALGVNDSMIHEDFMIGAADLDIDGITETGERVAIFRNGDWAD